MVEDNLNETIDETSNGAIISNGGSINKITTKETRMNGRKKIVKELGNNLTEPPDGGTRAIIVMISAFLCNGIIFGVINSYGIIYTELKAELEARNDSQSSSKAALVGSLTIGTTFLFSPVSGILTDKIGLRITTLIGGILTTGGMLLSSIFINNIKVLCFTYGFMYGLGAALAYTPSLAILGHYFKRYIGLASGFVTAGSSIFTIFMPIILTELIPQLGLSNTLRVVALFCSFIIVCALLYKPLLPPPPPLKNKPGRSIYITFLKSIIYIENWKKRKYLIWAISIPIALFGYFVPYVHIVEYVKVNFVGSDFRQPLICIGITSGVGRILFGFIADFPKVNRIFLQQISFVMMGIMSMLIPFTNSYMFLLMIFLMMGLFDGCFISLLGPIAYDICGSRGATQAIGFLLGLCSLPLTVGPPIAGILYDTTQSYTLSFILSGIPSLIGACMMFLIVFIKDESPISDVNSADPSNQPLAKIAWDTENGEPQINSNLVNKAAIIASAETLTDNENETEKL